MAINIMNQYINLTKKEINDYMRLVFGNKFNKDYNEAYVEKYINIRYYNFYENDVNSTIRRKILDYLKQTEEEMSINHIEDRELLEQMRIFFYYVLYFDNVVYYKDLGMIIKKISKLRNKILNKETDNFEQKLFEKIVEFKEKKDNLLKRFETDEFFIKLSNYPDKINVYRVNLKYNIKLPLVYSEFAINKAFNTGITNEDKLTIEYYLVVVQILKDILKQNFKKKYIVEFTDTILVKPKKLKGLLNIINNPGAQDKICLKIRYEQFLDNKDKIYELMRNGFKIAVILDNSFEINYKNIENLKMFQFIMINKNLKHYDELRKYKKNIQNVIEI